MIRPQQSKVPPPPPSCPLEGCLKFLAGAWTPKILWYLRAEPRRFGDLKRDLSGISAKVLTTRLRELEERGVVTRTVMPTSPPTVEYALTPLGQRFQPVLDAIVEVGHELEKHAKPAMLRAKEPLITQFKSTKSPVNLLRESSNKRR